MGLDGDPPPAPPAGPPKPVVGLGHPENPLHHRLAPLGEGSPLGRLARRAGPLHVASGVEGKIAGYVGVGAVDAPGPKGAEAEEDGRRKLLDVSKRGCPDYWHVSGRSMFTCSNLWGKDLSCDAPKQGSGGAK